MVIERHIELERAGGERLTIRLALGIPAQRLDGTWECAVAADGLIARLPCASGVDAMQSLLLAQLLLRRLLETEVSRGARIFFFDQPLTVAELFEIAAPPPTPGVSARC